MQTGHSEYVKSMRGTFCLSLPLHFVCVYVCIFFIDACMLFPVYCFFGSDAGGLVRALTKFSHLAADTITNGSATAHMAPTDQADRKSTHL